jgi:putative tricarboxylic transport membrane protein
MKKSNQMGSIVWLLFALYIVIESVRLPLGSFRDPGPGFLPLLVGIILGILSAVSFFQARAEKGPALGTSWYPKERWKSLSGVLIALITYAGALEIIGFLISTFLFLVFLFRSGLESRSWFWAIGGSALSSFACYAVFDLWLRAQLPKGFLGF